LQNKKKITYKYLTFLTNLFFTKYLPLYLKFINLKRSIMNIKHIISSAFLVAVMLTSCKKDLEPQPSSETPVTESTVPETQNIEQKFDVQDPNPQTVQAPSPVQTQAAPTAAGMNPPHGQPNHRCDIAVGTPLNAPKGAAPVAPAPPPAPVMQQAPQGKASITPVDMSSGTTATKPGMNPPHGQPGHKCEVAVGAPLPE
jgi:hypothetical protein